MTRPIALGLFGLLALLGSLTMVGCAGTRTGNPGDGPTYDSGGRFMDDPSGGVTGSDGGGCWVGGAPSYGLAGGDLARLVDGNRLVAAIDDRGVLVVDVSDPTAPRIEGELAIDGSPLAFDVDADGAGATLVVLEYVSLSTTDVDALPAQVQPDRQVRLVRVDLSDPTAPRRVYDLAIEDEFWQIAVREDRAFVLEQVVETPNRTCNDGGGLLIDIGWEGDCPMPTAMRATAYDITADAFVERESTEVAAAWNTAYVAGDTFFVVDHYGGPDATIPQTLSWIDFGSGVLVEGGPVTLPGRPTALDRAGDLVAMLVEDPFDASLALQLLDLGNDTLRGAVDVTGNLTDVTIDPRGFVVLDGAVVHLVDVTDPATPVLASTLPSDVKRIVATGSGALGFGSGRGGEDWRDLTLSLWDLSDPAAPVRVDDLETDWFVQTDQAPWTIDEDRGSLLLPFNRPPHGPDDAFELAVVAFDATSLALQSTQPSRVHAWHNIFHPLGDGTHVYAPSPHGLEVFPLDVDAEEPEPVSALVRVQPERTIDSIEVDGTTVSLHERDDDGVFEVHVASGSSDITILDLDHRADALVEIEGAVAVLGLRGEAAECEWFADEGIDGSPELDPNPQDGIDPCAPHRMRGVSVIALGDPPRVTGTFPITSDMDVEPMDGVTARADWPGYVRLDGGRLVLFAQRTRSCSSYASCDALGVPAYESMGSPGCNPDVQNCDELPRVQVFVSGYEHTLGLYELVGAGGDDPALSFGPVLDGRFELDGEASLDQGPRMVSLTDGFAFAREEPIYNDEGNSRTNTHGDPISRWYLQQVGLDADGALLPELPVNTPGRPVALDGDTVYSVDPDYTGDGAITVMLHRSILRDAGAYLEDSTDLGGGFNDVRVVDDHLFVLRGPLDLCAEDLSTELFAVALSTTELTIGDALTLPGASWRFPFGEPVLDDEGRLVLHGGPFLARGRLYVDIRAPLSPVADAYVTDRR